jgi:hypothetical protein
MSHGHVIAALRVRRWPIVAAAGKLSGRLCRPSPPGEAVQARARERAADLAPIVKELQAAGAGSLRAIATGLNVRRVPTPTGGEWGAVQVSRLLKRLPE